MGGASSAFLKAEEELLTKGIQWWTRWNRPSEPASAPNVSFKVKNVDLGNGLHIHTAEYACTNPEAASQPAGSDGTDKLPLVAMHGYGTGLGIYFAALPALAEKWRGPLFAIDSLGCGLSSRPRWHLGKGENCAVEDAEDFFVDGLERWRNAMQVEHMLL